MVKVYSTSYTQDILHPRWKFGENGPDYYTLAELNEFLNGPIILQDQLPDICWYHEVNW